MCYMLVDCPECEGEGRFVEDTMTVDVTPTSMTLAQVRTITMCEECHGTGEVEIFYCSATCEKKLAPAISITGNIALAPFEELAGRINGMIALPASTLTGLML